MPGRYVKTTTQRWVRFVLSNTTRVVYAAKVLLLLARLASILFSAEGRSRMTFGELIGDFEKAHMPKLARPTQKKYASLLRCHIKPQFAAMPVKELTTKKVDEWLSAEEQQSLSWATRVALRNLMCGIFTRAEIWATYDGKNPVKRATVGRKRSVYEKRKLTLDQTRRLLMELPEDVRIVCMVALFCGLRISEVLGLMWKHVDFDRGVFLIRQRYWAGDLDVTKTEASERDVPFGELYDLLFSLYPGPEHCERFCFDVRTQSIAGRTRDDHSMRRYFLQPAAKKLGFYYKGFGFHSFRREAITAITKEAGVMQANKLAGHTKLNTTYGYVLNDYEEQERAVRKMQEPFKNAGLLKPKTGTEKSPKGTNASRLPKKKNCPNDGSGGNV
jgi:integrase